MWLVSGFDLPLFGTYGYTVLNENRKLLVEQADQEASFGEEKSSVMRPARTYIPSAKQQQVG